MPLKDTSTGLTRSNSLEKRRPFARPFTKARFEPAATARMASPTPNESTVLLKQNQDLRQRLQEEAGNYRKRLDTYKQAQQNQAALVGRLQNKVLQYKQRCTDLEGKMHDVLPITPRTAVSIRIQKIVFFLLQLSCVDKAVVVVSDSVN